MNKYIMSEIIIIIDMGNNLNCLREKNLDRGEKKLLGISISYSLT